MGSSTDAGDKFCLRWNDFQANVSGAFRDLRADADFFDVTLVCNDEGRSIPAHKVILAACSQLFKQMLRSCNSPANPVIFLRGIKLADLQSVMDFVYHGEVNVAQDQLNSFLSVAEDLQIKGLTQHSTNSENESHETVTKSSGVTRKTPPTRGQSRSKKMKKSDYIDVTDIKTESNAPEAAGSSADAEVEVNYEDPDRPTEEASGFGEEHFDEDGDYQVYEEEDGTPGNIMEQDIEAPEEGHENSKGNL